MARCLGYLGVLVIGITPGVQNKDINHEGLFERVVEPMYLPDLLMREKDLEANPVDMYITDIGGDAEYNSFNKIEELVETGYITMKSRIPELKQLLFSH